MQPYLVAAQGLKKTYSGGVEAVRGVSFGIRPGICFGLLGPNGAGKTTTIEMMEGILPASAGEVLYKGQPIGEKFRMEVGIQFQQTALQDYLKVHEVLRLFQNFYKKSLPIETLVEMCSLSDILNRDAKKLSGGQRQRVLLALALVNDPEIVFLDEPTTGLDPQARRHFWSLVKRIKAANKTLVLTTHYMEEAYELCDEIAVVDQGLIIAQGTPDALLNEHFPGSVRVQLPKELESQLRDLPWPIEPLEDHLEIVTSDLKATLDTLLLRKISLDGLQVRKPTLEDLFLKLTGHQLRA